MVRSDGRTRAEVSSATPRPGRGPARVAG